MLGEGPLRRWRRPSHAGHLQSAAVDQVHQLFGGREAGRWVEHRSGCRHAGLRRWGSALALDPATACLRSYRRSPNAPGAHVLPVFFARLPPLLDAPVPLADRHRGLGADIVEAQADCEVGSQPARLHVLPGRVQAQQSSTMHSSRDANDEHTLRARILR